MDAITTSSPQPSAPAEGARWWRRRRPDSTARADDARDGAAPWWALVIDWLAELDWDLDD